MGGWGSQQGKMAGADGDASLCHELCEAQNDQLDITVAPFWLGTCGVCTEECFHLPFLFFLLSSQKISMIKPMNSQ